MVQPEEITPGHPRRLRVHLPRSAAAGCGLHVMTREGRPIKLEGNPEHPDQPGRAVRARSGEHRALLSTRTATRQPQRRAARVVSLAEICRGKRRSRSSPRGSSEAATAVGRRTCSAARRARPRVGGSIRPVASARPGGRRTCRVRLPRARRRLPTQCQPRIVRRGAGEPTLRSVDGADFVVDFGSDFLETGRVCRPSTRASSRRPATSDHRGRTRGTRLRLRRAAALHDGRRTPTSGSRRTTRQRGTCIAARIWRGSRLVEMPARPDGRARTPACLEGTVLSKFGADAVDAADGRSRRDDPSHRRSARPQASDPVVAAAGSVALTGPRATATSPAAVMLLNATLGRRRARRCSFVAEDVDGRKPSSYQRGAWPSSMRMNARRREGAIRSTTATRSTALPGRSGLCRKRSRRSTSSCPSRFAPGRDVSERADLILPDHTLARELGRRTAAPRRALPGAADRCAPSTTREALVRYADRRGARRHGCSGSAREENSYGRWWKTRGRGAASLRDVAGASVARSGASVGRRGAGALGPRCRPSC